MATSIEPRRAVPFMVEPVEVQEARHRLRLEREAMSAVEGWRDALIARQKRHEAEMEQLTRDGKPGEPMHIDDVYRKISGHTAVFYNRPVRPEEFEAAEAALRVAQAEHAAAVDEVERLTAAGIEQVDAVQRCRDAGYRYITTKRGEIAGRLMYRGDPVPGVVLDTINPAVVDSLLRARWLLDVGGWD